MSVTGGGPGSLETLRVISYEVQRISSEVNDSILDSTESQSMKIIVP